jgi:hypothetical protein
MNKMNLDNIAVLDFSSLVSIVESHEIKELPIAHIPSVWSLGKIMKEGILMPQLGNKYYENEKLLFFNYGRCPFMPTRTQTLKNDPFPPICFLFRIDKISLQPKRLLPFDSGGFDKYERLQPTTVYEYEIRNPCLDDVNKLVAVLFKSNENYLKFEHDFKEVAEACVLLPHLTLLEQHYNFVMQTQTGIGKQGKSFELQYSDAVTVAPILVVCPTNFMSNPARRRQFELVFKSCQVLCYEGHLNPEVALENMNKSLNKFMTDGK